MAEEDLVTKKYQNPFNNNLDKLKDNNILSLFQDIFDQHFLFSYSFGFPFSMISFVLHEDSPFKRLAEFAGLAGWEEWILKLRNNGTIESIELKDIP